MVPSSKAKNPNDHIDPWLGRAKISIIKKQEIVEVKPVTPFRKIGGQARTFIN